MPAEELIPNNRVPQPGWVGGYATIDRAFTYPNPDLSSIPLTANMDNIPKLQRQVHVLWPEFTWETVQGDPASRCYQMFAPDISRGGYDHCGRFWSIICPQQGSCSPTLGCLNIEVTVTGQRGWIDETSVNRNLDLLAADMTVAGRVWFSPSAKDKPMYNFVKQLLEDLDLPFPLDKAHAIEVELHKVHDPETKVLPVRSGLTSGIPYPDFALHLGEAWAVANVGVGIGALKGCGNIIVDEFNALVMEIFNFISGNVLQQGNTLTWNVWFDAPAVVDREEWADHARYWRDSIDADHGSPDGKGTRARYIDGTYFTPFEGLVQAEFDMIKAWVAKHFPDALERMPPREA